MDSLVKAMPNIKKFNDFVFDVKKGITPIMLSGLSDVGKIHLAYSTKFYTDKPICIITYNELQAKKIIKDLSYFEEDVLFFPKRDVTSFDYISESKDVLFDRISVLNKLIEHENIIIVTTIEAAMQKMISKDVLYKNVLDLKVGDTYNLEDLKEKLVLLGYERYDAIEGKGQFSVRGGIVDVATSAKSGIRIEFWGDEIDSIREFKISTQRTVEMLDKIKIYPSYEFLLEKDVEQVAKNIQNKKFSVHVQDKVDEDIKQIRARDYLTKIDKYFDCFYEKSNTLLDYLNKDTLVFIDEIGKIKNRAENIAKDNENLTTDLIAKNKIIPSLLTKIDDYLTFTDKLESYQSIYLEKQDIGFVDKQSMHAKRNGYSFSYREVNFFRGSMDLLFEELQKRAKDKKKTVVLCGSMENVKKFETLLQEKKIKYFIDENMLQELVPGVVVITTGTLSAGFESYDLEFLVIVATELFSVKEQKRRPMSQSFKEGETIIFADLKIGDYVVHKVHGIGEYIGVNTIKADGVTKDYIKVKYKDGDILYIPTSSLDNIRKYIGTGDGKPKINRLGSKEWEQTKTKVKNNLREVARELIELYAKRQHTVGYAFSPDTIWQKEFEDSFQYVETDDQLRCIEEMKKDMESNKPMDRLLCGDVGYGKTEVAIRGAFKAVMDQKQVAYLVPTTILAEQQYQSFKERMEKFPIRVALLNRFKTKKEQTQIIEKLKKGEIDVLIRNS